MAQPPRLMTPSSRHQAGFTLVEMMVAMSIGLIVTLGAGQLFIISLQSFQTTRALGERQALLMFTMQSLAQDIRRAREPAFDNGILTVSREGDGDCAGTFIRQYRQGDFLDRDEGWELNVREWCQGESAPAFQPFVAGLAEGGFEPRALGDGVWLLALRLFSTEHQAEVSLSLHVVNRAQALREP